MKKTPEFLSLQAEWYKKLKDSGFVDHEIPSKFIGTTKEHTPYLKGSLSVIINRRKTHGTKATKLHIAITQERFLDLSCYLEFNRHHNFTDWYIGMRYVELLSMRDIHKELRGACCRYPPVRSGKFYSLQFVHSTIQRLFLASTTWNYTNKNGRHYKTTKKDDDIGFSDRKAKGFHERT